MPAPSDLSDDQRTVLAAVMEPAVPAAQRSEAALQERTGLAHHVARVLRELEDFDPPLVEGHVDEGVGTRVWRGTLAAGELLDRER